MTGRLCENVFFDRRPKLLLIDPGHPSVAELARLEDNYDRQARLCSETKYLANLFASVSLETWRQLKLDVDRGKIIVSEIAFELSVWLNRPLPSVSSLHELQSQFHLLKVCWFSFKPLIFLAEQYLSGYSDLMAGWSNYRAIFYEYCSCRSLKQFVSVFFQVEEQNVFLLEVDEHYNNFTLSDIEAIRDSLSIAIGIPSVCLHLVTVRPGSIIIYFYYSYADYLSVFSSLTIDQLQAISEIKDFKVLSITDLHRKFSHANIQNHATVSIKKYI